MKATPFLLLLTFLLSISSLASVDPRRCWANDDPYSYNVASAIAAGLAASRAAIDELHGVTGVESKSQYWADIFDTLTDDAAGPKAWTLASTTGKKAVAALSGNDCQTIDAAQFDTSCWETAFAQLNDLNPKSRLVAATFASALTSGYNLYRGEQTPSQGSFSDYSDLFSPIVDSLEIVEVRNYDLQHAIAAGITAGAFMIDDVWLQEDSTAWQAVIGDLDQYSKFSGETYPVLWETEASVRKAARDAGKAVAEGDCYEHSKESMSDNSSQWISIECWARTFSSLEGVDESYRNLAAVIARKLVGADVGYSFEDCLTKFAVLTSDCTNVHDPVAGRDYPVGVEFDVFTRHIPSGSGFWIPTPADGFLKAQ